MRKAMPSRVAFLGVFVALSILVGLVEAIGLAFMLAETTTMSWAGWIDGVTSYGLRAGGSMIGSAILPVLAIMCRARFRTVAVLGLAGVVLVLMGSQLPDVTVDQLHEVASGSNSALSMEIGTVLIGVLNALLGVIIAIYVAHRLRCFAPDK